MLENLAGVNLKVTAAQPHTPAATSAVADAARVLLKTLFADSAYDCRNLMDKGAYLDVVIEIIRRINGELGFRVLPRCWVVDEPLAG